jgi:hypothetical protein
MIARGLNTATGGDEATPGAIDVAPGTIENAFKTVTGGTGTFLSDVFWNLPVKAMTPNAEITRRDLPLIRNFLGIVDGMNDSALLYERRRAILEARTVLKNYDSATNTFVDSGVTLTATTATGLNGNATFLIKYAQST